jgi:hypothetical protein
MKVIDNEFKDNHFDNEWLAENVVYDAYCYLYSHLTFDNVVCRQPCWHLQIGLLEMVIQNPRGIR